MVRMVPERAGLSGDREFIAEGISRNDRALGDSDRAICPLGSTLKETMPMLSHIRDQLMQQTMQMETDNASGLDHGAVVQFVYHIDVKFTILKTHHEGIFHVKCATHTF
jgi:hypothetical protein